MLRTHSRTDVIRFSDLFRLRMSNGKELNVVTRAIQKFGLRISVFSFHKKVNNERRQRQMLETKYQTILEKVCGHRLLRLLLLLLLLSSVFARRASVSRLSRTAASLTSARISSMSRRPRLSCCCILSTESRMARRSVSLMTTSSGPNMSSSSHSGSWSG